MTARPTVLEGGSKSQASTSGGSGSKNGGTPRVPFDTEAHWKAEEKLSNEDRRDRFNGTSIITLDDIPTWADHAETLVERIDESAVRASLIKRFTKHDAASVRMVTKLADLDDRSIEKARLMSYDWDNYDLQFSFVEEQLEFEVNEEINRKVSLHIGDITTLEIDGIVNAANMAMRGGGGIDGRIHQVAGPTLLEECIELNGCKTGFTKVTRGHNLPARFILHTVGPRVQDDAHPLPQTKLNNCYLTCLDWVSQMGLRSVAFCCISTGIFNYPLETATHTALKAVRTWFKEGNNINSIDRIIFCVYGKPEWDMYEKLLQIYFPVPPASSLTVRLPSLKRASPVQSSFNGVTIADTASLLQAIQNVHKPRSAANEIERSAQSSAVYQNNTDAITSPASTTTSPIASALDLGGLEALIGKLSKSESKKFFKTILPHIINLAMNRKKILANWEPNLLEQGGSQSNTLTPEQTACLLACAFLTIIPEQSLHCQRFSHFSMAGLWKSFESSQSNPSTIETDSSKKNNPAESTSQAPGEEATSDSARPKSKQKKSRSKKGVKLVDLVAIEMNAEARFRSLLAFFESSITSSTTNSVAATNTSPTVFTRRPVPAVKDTFDWRQANNKLVPVRLMDTPLNTAPAPQATLLPVHRLVGRDFFVHCEKLSQTDRFIWSCPSMLVLALFASSLLVTEVIHATNIPIHSVISSSPQGVLSFEGRAASTPPVASVVNHAVLIPMPECTVSRHQHTRWYIFSNLSRIMGAIRTITGGLKIACSNWCSDVVFAGNPSILNLVMLFAVTSFETLQIGETFKDKKRMAERLANCPEIFLYESGAAGQELLALMEVIASQYVQYDILLSALMGNSILSVPYAEDGSLIAKLTHRFANWKKEFKEYQKAKLKERRALEKKQAMEAAEREKERARKRREIEKQRKAAQRMERTQKVAGTSNGSAKPKPTTAIKDNSFKNNGASAKKSPVAKEASDSSQEENEEEEEEETEDGNNTSSEAEAPPSKTSASKQSPPAKEQSENSEQMTHSSDRDSTSSNEEG